MLSVGSVCSGAGGFDLGFRNAGYRTAWLCEFDPWRQQLLAKNFPGVKCWPDLSTLDPAELERPNVLIGGTPCQDLSVAGQRAGLDGERSGLFWDYMRIRNELGIEWCVWENVAGALSSNNGLDFASVLGAMVGADVHVPSGGWPGAGVAAGPWGGCVWRLLDAQHFGVPQRRRRVFVVGHLGGPCPPEVLLESSGGSGDLEARGGAGPRVAAPLTRGSSHPGVNEPGRRQEDDVNIVNALDTQRGGADDNSAQAGHLIAGALTRRVGKGVDSDGLGMPLVADFGASHHGGSGTDPASTEVEEPGRERGAEGAGAITHTLTAAGFDASEDGTGRGTPIVAAQRLLLDGEPREREQRGHQPDAEGGERAGDSLAAGGAAGRDGAPADADGVRAPDELAGRMDGAPVSFAENQRGEVLANPVMDSLKVGGGKPGQGYPAILGTGTERNASAHDPQPDGRRYAACGDGVVSNVAEWIARRLADVIQTESSNRKAA